MLKVSNISKSYDGHVVLQDISFVVSSGEHIGLLGANGSGKSTLLRLIAGLEAPDTGSIWIDPNSRVAYLPQYPESDLELTVKESIDKALGGLYAVEEQISEIERKLSYTDHASIEDLLDQYTKLREMFDLLGGYELEAKVDAVLKGLRFDGELDTPVSQLSGGNKTKLSIAKVILSDANLLLLDEPTNYLDLSSLLWLEEFLSKSSKSYIVVSHDRRFLDKTVESILELDKRTHSIRTWPGNYTAYNRLSTMEKAKALERYQDFKAETERIQQDIRRTKEQAKSTESKTNNDTARRLAKKVAAKAKARERRLERYLEENKVERPPREWSLDLRDLGKEAIDDNRTILDIQGLTVEFDGKRVINNLSLHLRGRDRVAILGPNGSGKSTLLKSILGLVPYKGRITIGQGVRIGYISQELLEVSGDERVIDIFRSRVSMHEVDARNYLHKFLFQGDEAIRPASHLSYGQRIKLALALITASAANFLVLDEPTSHIDMPAIESLEESLSSYTGPLLLVSHDRYFLKEVGVNRLEVICNGKLITYSSLEEYEEVLHG